MVEFSNSDIPKNQVPDDNSNAPLMCRLFPGLAKKQNGRFGPFHSLSKPITVDSDNQKITERPGSLQVTGMTGMEHVPRT